MKSQLILVINPGSTSTKIALYDRGGLVFEEISRHSHDELAAAADMGAALALRKGVVIGVLEKRGVAIPSLAAIMCRGGLLRPLAGGVYAVNEKMLADLSSNRYGTHASSLGAMLGHELGEPYGIKAYIADPIVVDEFEPLARLSGSPLMERRSIFHALNQKAVGRRFAGSINKSYRDVNLIVAHMGGGCSVGAHRRGRVIDANDALEGDGPYGAERAGGLPVARLASLCYSGRFPSCSELIAHLKTASGLMGYAGTNDGRELSRRIDQGDEAALLHYRGMAYQISKEIGAAAAVLKGQVDGIILTGGFAHDRRFTSWIEEWVGFIAPVTVMPGEDEMQALHEAGRRVLSGEETPIEY